MIRRRQFEGVQAAGETSGGRTRFRHASEGGHPRTDRTDNLSLTRRAAQISNRLPSELAIACPINSGVSGGAKQRMNS
ncbi:MAG: hypothetical protein RJB37_2974 [Pseudomonadota bacterium]